MANNNQQSGGKGSMILAIVVIILVLGGLGSCMKGEEDHNDGKCDICGKTATYSDGDEEYCRKHLESAVEWYIKQGQDD